MSRPLIFCILRVCTSLRQRQQAEFWGALSPLANPLAGLGGAAQVVLHAINAASDNQVTTMIAMSGTRARDLLLDNGSHLYNMKVVLTKIMRGENYPVFDESSGFVVADGVANLIVEENLNTENTPNGPWFLKVKWTPTEAVAKGVQSEHWKKLLNQEPAKLTRWIIENVPYDWYDSQRERVYMKNESEFKIEALGSPVLATAFTVTGTRALSVLCGESKVYNLEAIISRIMEGGAYTSTGRFGLEVTNTQKFGSGDGPWTIYATWTATPIEQCKYFHKLKKGLNMQALTRWVIKNVPWDYGRIPADRKDLKDETEFNFTSVV